MGPTKAVVKQQALYHAVSGKLIPADSRAIERWQTM